MVVQFCEKSPSGPDKTNKIYYWHQYTLVEAGGSSALRCI
jgi:hypothetical protein